MKRKSDYFAIVKKEFLGFINSPLAYLIIAPFLLISQYLFFRTALVVGDANLRPFIEILPWFLVVIAPALTMRSFADEYKQGTVELLFAHPISEWRLVLAKYTGLLLFYATMLATTLALPGTLLLFANPDLGLMVGQYLGAFLVGALFLSVGLMMSTWIKSSIGSFLVATAVAFSLLLMGSSFVVLGVPSPLNKVLLELGVVSHVNNLGRGVIDLRDLIYFGTLIGIALTISVIKLSERKLAESNEEKRKLWIVLGLLVTVGVVINIGMSVYPVRMDLTDNQRYSLSSGTKKMLQELPDRVLIELYVSDNLPGPMQLTQREVSDRLRDFSRYGGNKIQVDTSIVDPDDVEAKTEATKKGIQEITFNQIASGSFQAQTGVLGLAIRYGDKTEVLPFIQDGSNLEYQLARMILKMTRESQSKLGLVDATNNAPLSGLQQLLADQYQLEILDANNTNWQDLAGIIVVDDGSEKNATSAASIKNYLENQGNAMFLVDGVNINEQLLTPTVSESEIISVLAGEGITIQKDLVYDLQQAENITLPGGPNGEFQYIIPYPFWIRANVIRENMPLAAANLSNVLLAWASSIQIGGAKSDVIKPLLNTSQASGTQEGGFTIRPDQTQTLEPSGKVKVVGAIKDSEVNRMAVVGDAQLVFDDYLQNAPVNQAFIANMIDWIAKDEVLSAIPQRAEGRVPFNFNSKTQLQTVQYGALLLPPVIVVIFGIFWLSRRKKLTRRTWSAQGEKSDKK
jgi:ABC-2 type transport system permease protein